MGYQKIFTHPLCRSPISIFLACWKFSRLSSITGASHHPPPVRTILHRWTSLRNPTVVAPPPVPCALLPHCPFALPLLITAFASYRLCCLRLLSPAQPRPRIFPLMCGLGGPYEPIDAHRTCSPRSTRADALPRWCRLLRHVLRHLSPISITKSCLLLPNRHPGWHPEGVSICFSRGGVWKNCQTVFSFSFWFLGSICELQNDMYGVFCANEISYELIL